MDPAAPLKNFKPHHDFFVGIDSDGCAFDTMEIKHKECFIPNIIKYWGLQPVSKFAREAAEFVNLYSKFRGTNRWPALVKVFELLQDRPEAMERNPKFPDTAKLQAYIDSGRALSSDGIRQMFEETGDPIYKRAMEWNAAVNRDIDAIVEGIPPFPHMRESLEKLFPKADIIVVSATPGPALIKEWNEHDIAKYMRVIAGQEMGTKAEHFKYAANGRYAKDKVLMIGDALGDLKAARANGALFYPINPGGEARSWKRFHDEASDRFFNGTYAGAYETALIEEFDACLPAQAPWQKMD